MKVVTIHIPEPYLEAIDELVKRGLYPNRAEAIRMAVRDYIFAMHRHLNKRRGLEGEDS